MTFIKILYQKLCIKIKLSKYFCTPILSFSFLHEDIKINKIANRI